MTTPMATGTTIPTQVSEVTQPSSELDTSTHDVVNARKKIVDHAEPWVRRQKTPAMKFVDFTDERHRLQWFD